MEMLAGTVGINMQKTDLIFKGVEGLSSIFQFDHIDNTISLSLYFNVT